MREQRAAMHPCEIWNLELFPSVSPLPVVLSSTLFPLYVCLVLKVCFEPFSQKNN